MGSSDSYLRGSDTRDGEMTFGDYARVLWRHKLVVIGCAILFALAGVGYSAVKQRPFQSSAQVLLGQFDPSTAARMNVQEAARGAATQAALANSPVIALRVLVAAHVKTMTPNQFLKKATVVPSQNADLLTFTVRDSNPTTAIALVNEYARQFVAYSRGLGGASTKLALASLQQRIHALAVKNGTRTPLYAQLVTRYQDLLNSQTLAGRDLLVSKQAITASRAAAHLKRNAVVGLAAGLVLGLLLAFLLESLDTRVRSEADVSELLGLPLLARLSTPRRRGKGALVALDQRGSVPARQYTALRRQLSRIGHAQTVLVVEATKPEYGPIVAANLAVELAHAGNRVSLVELTPGWLRYAELFNLGARNDRAVVLGQLSSSSDGFLEVLPATPSTGNIYDENELARIIASASGQLVIASGPPLLDDADPEAFVDAFDATILVVPLQNTSKGALAKLGALIGQFAKPPVGFVAVGDQAAAAAVAAQGQSRPSTAEHDLEPAARPRPVVAPVATSAEATLDADWGRGH